MAELHTNTADPQPNALVDIAAARRLPEQARSRERVEGILDTAAELIARDGIDAMTMSRLANAAGVTLPSIYRYFPNKPAILQTLMVRYAAQILGTVTDGIRPADTPAGVREQLASAVHRYWRLFQDDPEYAAVWAAAIADPELAQADVQYSRDISELMLGLYGDVLPESLPDRSETALLLTYLAGAVARVASIVEPCLADRLVNVFAERIVPGALGLLDDRQ